MLSGRWVTFSISYDSTPSSLQIHAHLRYIKEMEMESIVVYSHQIYLFSCFHLWTFILFVSTLNASQKNRPGIQSCSYSGSKWFIISFQLLVKLNQEKDFETSSAMCELLKIWPASMSQSKTLVWIQSNFSERVQYSDNKEINLSLLLLYFFFCCCYFHTLS